MVQGLSAIGAYLGAKEIALWEKLLAVAFVLAYIISPIDLIPDAPIIGWIDDIGVSALFVYFCKYRVNYLAEKTSQEEKKKIINITPADAENYETCKEIECQTSKPFFFSKKTDRNANR